VTVIVSALVLSAVNRSVKPKTMKDSFKFKQNSKIFEFCEHTD